MAIMLSFLEGCRKGTLQERDDLVVRECCSHRVFISPGAERHVDG